ncbi:uncharacterized protein B0P05DRAFT_82179 [Gilbertella persicaria]|uniref:uncharacterized protein n=1 Tax=Gilbertella persicaria TaxID=101096 RepID=UPI00221FDAD3|nr:uncharacterized protein B0P05DRAFT_82179 [Gilbertella persicaria]KAI8080274.1 hypothetical protein B0P05DRAFT_82179 [Gilbertella persicaria]
MRSNCTVEAKFENTPVHEIKSDQAWIALFHSIQHLAFYDIFLNHVILKRLPNGSYYQLAGPLLFGKHNRKEGQAVPTKKKRKLNDYFSTFLSDIGSNASHLSHYLDSLLYSKKRPLELPKLSRRQRRKLKSNKRSEPAKQKRPVETIDRASLFYCANYVIPNTDKVMMRLPKDHILQKLTAERYDFIEYCLSKLFPKEFTKEPKRVYLSKDKFG